MAELRLLETQDDLPGALACTTCSSSASRSCAPIPRGPAGTAPSPSRANNDEAQNTRLQRRDRRRPAHDVDAARRRRADRRRAPAWATSRSPSSRAIDHIFVTHSHMDHVTSIPFLVDTVGWMRDKPITIYATRETLAILHEHLFNWKLWPDFSQIPDPARADAALPGDRGRRAGAARRAHDHRAAGEPRGAGGRLPDRFRERRASSSPATRRPTTRCGRT